MLVKQTAEIFKNFDAILLPTSPGTAFPLGSSGGDPVATYLADIYTVLANLAGIAAASLPLFSHSNNMPFGLQVMSNKADELTLLQISDQLLRRHMQPLEENPL